MMTDAENTSNPQFYELSESQAARLAEMQLGPEAEEMVRSFGAQAIEGAYGVVITELEDGTKVPDRIIDLSGDLGTTVRPEKANPELGIPDLLTAHQLALQAKEGQSPVEEERLSDESQIEAIVEESGIRETLSNYAELRVQLEQGYRVEAATVYRAEDELQQLATNLRMAAEQGSWSGNYLSNYPDLAGTIRGLAEVFNDYKVRAQQGNGERADSIEKYSGSFAQVSEEASARLQSVDSEPAYKLKCTLEDAQEALSTIKRKGEDNGSERVAIWDRTASLLDRVVHENLATVEDVHQDIQNAIRALTNISETTSMDTRNLLNVDEQIDMLHRLLAKK